jgi:hypothetical protein
MLVERLALAMGIGTFAGDQVFDLFQKSATSG